MLIFSTKRTLNSYINDIASLGGGFLPKLMVVDEFFSKSIYAKDKKRANAYESLVYMHKACLECESFSKLGLDREFFAFLKNKEYLFSFFKELAFFEKEIKDIKKEDIYAFYDEHLSILEEVLTLYKKNLDKNGLYDYITLKDYEINTLFLDDEVVFYLEGIINKFELTFFKKISFFSDVKIKFFVSKYNKNALQKTLNINLLDDYFYEIYLSKGELLSKNTKKSKNEKTFPKIYLKTFKDDYLQAFWVQEKISHLINLGINANKIALITPDESKTRLLRTLDFTKMLNYASGIDIKTTRFYKNYTLLMDLKPNLNKDSFTLSGVWADNISSDVLDLFYELKDEKSISFKQFYDFLDLLLKNDKPANPELEYHIKTELESFSVIFEHLKLNILELLELFYQSIKHLTLSHVGGGEVSVYGLLESRGMSFDAVIVVDFNDDLVPKRNVNELFLSNIVRKNSGLISYEDRENLQRHYYFGLFMRTKYVFISAVDNDEKIPSRFLKKINYELDNDYNDKDYFKLFEFGTKTLDVSPAKIGVKNYDFFEYPLSYSRLKNFVTNRQKYYLQYVLNICEPRALFSKPKPSNIGTAIHNSLYVYYKNSDGFKNYFDKDEFLKCFWKVCKEEFVGNEKLENTRIYAKSPKISARNDKKTQFNLYDFINKLDYELLLLDLEKFEKIENKRFKNGAKIIALEEETIEILENFTCFDGKKIQIKGRLDRVDLVDNKPCIIDYKYSNNQRQPLEQLVFYSFFHSFFNQDKNDLNFAFYYLKSDVNLKQQIDILQATQNIEKWLKDIIDFKNKIDFDGEFLNEKGKKYFDDYENYFDLILNKEVK